MTGQLPDWDETAQAAVDAANEERERWRISTSPRRVEVVLTRAEPRHPSCVEVTRVMRAGSLDVAKSVIEQAAMRAALDSVKENTGA